MTEFKEKKVVTCFLRNRGEVLLLRRSAEVGSYQGRWGAVSGYIEESPQQSARREIAEETALAEAVTLVRQGEPFVLEDESLATRWVVHPFLFDCAHRNLSTDWETTQAQWVSPTEILRRDTVPQLWTSYARVAPSVEDIRVDRIHGSAELSCRALEVLRDQAGWMTTQGQPSSAEWGALRELARNLLAARPSMAAVRNRINRVMHACRDVRAAQAVDQAARENIARAYEADARTARQAAGYLSSRRVLTLSRSGTVLDAIRQSDPAPDAVFVAESRPGGEGVAVAEVLARDGLNTSLIHDSVVGHVLQAATVDMVMVGADTVLRSGDVVNKVGTQLAALAARRYDVPFYVVTASDKISTDDRTDSEDSDRPELYSGPLPIRVVNPLFDTTPANLITAFITEDGKRWSDQVRELVVQFEKLARW